MGKRKAKNKLTIIHNVDKNAQKKKKTSTNLAQNSECKVIKTQTHDKKSPVPIVISKNREITQFIAQKISILSKNSKVWIQRETENALKSIETSKKQLVKIILCSTKSICTKLLETIDQTLDTAKIQTF